MKKLTIIVMLTSIIYACSLNGQEDKSSLQINDSIDKANKETVDTGLFKFVSKIRPDATDLSPGKEYADVMTLLEFNDDYDYSFSVFVTKSGDTVTFNHSNRIDNAYKGQFMKVIWEVDTFYEAGEGDAMYFKERMISFELIKK